MSSFDFEAEMIVFAQGLEAQFGGQIVDMGMPDPEFEELQHTIRRSAYHTKMDAVAEQSKRAEFLRECVILGLHNDGESLASEQTFHANETVIDELAEMMEQVEVLEYEQGRVHKNKRLLVALLLKEILGEE